MSQSTETYYEFLSREEALSCAPIDSLDLAPEFRRVLKEAHRRMARLSVVMEVEHLG